MQIEKRDGTLVPYDNNKIILAIEKAMNEVDGMIYEHDTAKDIAYEIEKKIKSNSVPVSVEVMQDWVEDYLMRSERRDVARAYIRYRYKKEVARHQSNEFIEAIRGTVEKFKYTPHSLDDSFDMLEIPLFDMHWGIAFLDHYESTMNEILTLILSHKWKKIIIPFGQDFFHNDSIVKGQTTKGTAIEKVDMTRAVKEGQTFLYTIIDTAIENADEVRVLYTPGNHDLSMSWMFVQVLLERYGPEIVDDSLEYRKVFTYGKNSIMVTHGDSKQATARNLAQIFPISFAEEFSNAAIREVHSGHLHREGEADIYGVMVRRLSSGNLTDEWSNREDFIGAHKRFMLFEWSLDKLKSIHYV